MTNWALGLYISEEVALAAYFCLFAQTELVQLMEGTHRSAEPAVLTVNDLLW